MRSDVKLMFFGFCAGLGIGAFALTSVSASVEKDPKRGDRVSAPVRILSYDDLPAAGVGKALAPGEQAAVVEYFDARGRLVYRSDPATATTTVAKGTVIPTPTTFERDHAAPHIVRAGAEAPEMVSATAN